MASKLCRFRHLHKNRRLGPLIIRIDSRKESKFTCKRSIRMEIPGLISLLKLFFLRTDSHSGANSISEVNPDSVTGANCDSQVEFDSDRGIDSGIEIEPSIGLGSGIVTGHAIGIG